ncbi:MAG: TonB-dependent receptor, partial [Bacteroidota bacterium]
MSNSQPKTFLNITLVLLAALLFLAPGKLLAQQAYGTLKGKVVTANSQPAADISIGLTGTSFGTNTNALGEFTFKSAPGGYTLIISYIGVKTVEVPVTVTANQTTNVPQITVNASMAQLSEVNVIASRANRFARKISTDVGKIPLNNLENAQSYSTVTTELFKEQQIFTVDDALRNAPGLQKMWDATGRAGDGGGYFTLRGFVTQTRLRDGVAGLVTSGIDAVNIDKIEVIKGPSATLFGSTLTSFGGL